MDESYGQWSYIYNNRYTGSNIHIPKNVAILQGLHWPALAGTLVTSLGRPNVHCKTVLQAWMHQIKQSRLSLPAQETVHGRFCALQQPNNREHLLLSLLYQPVTAIAVRPV